MFEKYQPGPRDFIKLSKRYGVIPVSTIINTDNDPVLSLSAIREPAFVFERNGHSIFGTADEVFVFGKLRQHISFEIISKLLREEKAPLSKTFSGGLVGYIGYDLARLMFDMKVKKPDIMSLPNSVLLNVNKFYKWEKGKLKAVYCASLEDEPARIYRRAIEELDSMMNLPEPRDIEAPQLSNVSVNVKMTEYMKMVDEAKARISQGEIAQAIISRRISCRSIDPFTVFVRLRKINPCPYVFYLRVNDVCVLGSSPENFLTLYGNYAESRPVASTRRRGIDSKEDKALELELRKSPKERSEHAMLLDECVAEFKAACEDVKIYERLRVKKFPFFQHLVSRIGGRPKDKFGLLKATFPSATMTGVPKRKAMEVIDDVEPDARGPYAGSFGYVSSSGCLDMGIIVRTILIKGKTAHVPVGAGIVAQSSADAEYRETFYKSRAQLMALGASQEEMKWLSEI
ncbi:MAG: anthranilate synthase component I family protein [Candidatus Hadarchaeaceae archaeon]